MPTFSWIHLIHPTYPSRRQSGLAYPVGMTMIPVNSSAIAAAGYERGTLYVQFHNGRTYDYPGTPLSDFEGLINSPSPGAYYNEFIRLPPEPPEPPPVAPRRGSQSQRPHHQRSTRGQPYGAIRLHYR